MVQLKKIGKGDYEFLSQEFDSDEFDLVKQKEFYPDEYMCDFEKFKENVPRKEELYSLLTGKSKEYAHVVKVWDRFYTKKTFSTYI